MKKIGFYLVGVLFTTLLFSCGSGSSNSNSDFDWSGVYKYEEEAGPGMGGEPRFYEYTISIQKDGEGYTANYDIDGYQTMSRLVCGVTETSEGIELYFVELGEDDMFMEPREENSLILTMKQKEGNIFVVNDGMEMEFTKQ